MQLVSEELWEILAYMQNYKRIAAEHLSLQIQREHQPRFGFT